MSTETKEPLTIERIKSDMKSKITDKIISSSFAFVAWLVVLGIIIGIVYIFFIDSALVWLLLFLPVLCFVFSLFGLLTKMRWIKYENFSIIEDKLTGMKESEFNFNLSSFVTGYFQYGIASFFDDVLYFANFGKYIISGDGGVFKYSLVDDIFYVVVYNNQPNKPVGIYSTRIYEWKER